MIRAVVDTNTLVSGLDWRGTPSAVVDAILNERTGLVTSQPLLDELVCDAELAGLSAALVRVARESELAGKVRERARQQGW